MTVIVTVPFTPDQIEAISFFQISGHMHPFTCGQRERHPQALVLVASQDGVRCSDPQCDCTQEWVHPNMADLSAVRRARTETIGRGGVFAAKKGRTPDAPHPLRSSPHVSADIVTRTLAVRSPATAGLT